MQLYIFGYGSLMNPKSLAKTLPGERMATRTYLYGYQRKMNAPVNGYLYLNIVPRRGKRVEGAIIPISESEMGVLKEREPGYTYVDVSAQLERKITGVVYAFLAPDQVYPSLEIPHSYLNTCLAGKSDDEKDLWLQETLIENKIREDLENPVYVNSVIE